MYVHVCKSLEEKVGDKDLLPRDSLAYIGTLMLIKFDKKILKKQQLYTIFERVSTMNELQESFQRKNYLYIALYKRHKVVKQPFYISV